MKKQVFTIEYLIFDPELIDIASKNDYGRLESFIMQFPEHENVIRDAFVLLGNLRVKETMVSKIQIDYDYNKLMDSVSNRKRYDGYRWLFAAAACILFVLGFLLFQRLNENTIPRNDKAFALLDAIDINTDSIMLSNGASHISIAGNQTLSQTAKGGIVAADEELLKSTEIQEEFLQLVVPKGQRTSLRFNDGTIVWVNSGSKMIYPKVFGSNKREIFIDGEIYIEVAKDKGKPFFVNTKDMRVHVLGTKFNVNAYSEDLEKSIVLSEGAVKILTHESNQSEILKPNQGFFVVNGNSSVKNVDAYTFICWKDNLMKLEGAPLSAVFKRLSKYYAVEFHTDKDLTRERYTGTLKLGNSVDEVLRTLSFGTSFTYLKKDKDYYLKF
ncbi:FecR family protein [Pedobacter nyackensis]|uniref:FecR family protein n=1 Tax=Pedobacter nyackensis TaxID=475255 RepID=UPI00292CE897|nr:FecR family protein [Pedobacter nyackensis]